MLGLEMASITFMPLGISTFSQRLSFNTSFIPGHVNATCAGLAIVCFALALVIDGTGHGAALLACWSIHEIFKVKVLKVTSNHAFFIPYW